MVIFLQYNIAFIRESKRLRYDDMAVAVDCTVGMLKAYTVKDVTPPIDLLCRIADFAGITLDDLVRTRLTEANYNALRIKKGSKEPIIDPIMLIEKAVESLKQQRFERGKRALPKKLPTGAEKGAKQAIPKS